MLISLLLLGKLGQIPISNSGESSTQSLWTIRSKKSFKSKLDLTIGCNGPNVSRVRCALKGKSQKDSWLFNRKKLASRFSRLKLSMQVKFAQVVAFVMFLYVRQAIALRNGIYRKLKDYIYLSKALI
jgi:hypothetical protein